MRATDEFIKMVEDDINSLNEALADISNTETLEYAKVELYKDLTAKYHSYIPKFGDGLYGYYSELSFYDDVTGEPLYHNLRQIRNKMQAFKATGYHLLFPISEEQNGSIVVNANYSSQNSNNNYNENNNTIHISFDQVRRQIENMTSLSNAEFEEILSKIDELEHIVKSSDRKAKKWGNANEIIKWIADKGVDVGIAILPLLLQIT